MGPGSEARVVLVSPEENRLRYAINLHFMASNNVTEYEALVNRLRIAIELGATWLYVRGDSELVVDQVMKESSCKSPLTAAYCQEVRKLEGKFQGIKLHHIPRKDNDAADSLAKLAVKRGSPPDGDFVKDLHEPSACIREDSTQMRPAPDRMLGSSNASTQPNFDQALGGSNPDTAVMLLDPIDRRAPLLAYILEEVLPRRGRKRAESLDAPKRSLPSVMHLQVESVGNTHVAS
ncbi:uncharacterized protein LOC106804412 [Setaria italica]|uniref:uncharacterized protein LOC106804412 n=1 Tax=Setaria italica TaxID=4555 RepID=UPI0007199CAC|nr:uncharacterized protein LOC106804412 [Setaria italica]XP_034603426.1 uncharacterized protein Mb2253c-like [Setaria viridis]